MSSLRGDGWRFVQSMTLFRPVEVQFEMKDMYPAKKDWRETVSRVQRMRGEFSVPGNMLIRRI